MKLAVISLPVKQHGHRQTATVSCDEANNSLLHRRVQVVVSVVNIYGKSIKISMEHQVRRQFDISHGLKAVSRSSIDCLLSAASCCLSLPAGL